MIAKPEAKMARNYQKAAGNTWNPAKDSEGNKKTEPSESDYIEGIYRGYTLKELKYGKGRVHHILAEVVDGEQLGSEKIYDVIGNGIIDDELEGVLPGVPVYIKWLGKKQSKNDPDNHYNTFEVFFDQDEQDRLMKERAQGSAFKGAETQDQEQGQEQESSQNEQGSGEEESDDLPF